MTQAYTQDLYATIINRLNDWLNVAGGNVSDIGLDLMNRAQARLQREVEWDGRIYRHTCVMTGLSTPMPDNFLQEVRVFHDLNGDGKPDYFYYQNGDAQNGYKKEDVFALATGHVITFTFFSPLQGTPIVEYIPVLADFTGTGTEYSYFPGELILKLAQLIHSEEMPDDMTNGGLKAIEKSYQMQLQEYRRAHYGANRDTKRIITDYHGNSIRPGNMSLDGMNDGRSSSFSRDTDIVQYGT
jgi:hypothetical protein